MQGRADAEDGFNQFSGDGTFDARASFDDIPQGDGTLHRDKRADMLFGHILHGADEFLGRVLADVVAVERFQKTAAANLFKRCV